MFFFNCYIERSDFMLKRLCYTVSVAICLCVFAGCNYNEVKNLYNVVLYDNAVAWIDETFLRNNLTAGAYYEDIPNPGTPLPNSRCFIVKSEAEYGEILKEDSLIVDFETEMIIVYTFTIEYILPAKIKSINLVDGNLKIDYEIELIQGVGSACQPFQRWFVIKIDKLDVSSVTFL